MSMYNLAFGPTAQKLPILGLCGISVDRVGRFRDLWVEKDTPESVILAVYTRNGGGNRPDYTDEIEYMRSLPTFVSDADDHFDFTYATFRFRITVNDLAPDPKLWGDSAEDLFSALIRSAMKPVDTDARWQEAIEDLRG